MEEEDDMEAQKNMDDLEEMAESTCCDPAKKLAGIMNAKYAKIETF